LQKASEEVEGFKDAALRAQAEMENVRRRSAKDLENAHKYGLERFVNNLLPVIDSLEKAIESGAQAEQEGANKAVIEGVGLCHKMLVDVLIKEGVVVVDPMGEPFDPNVHQAMSVVENPDVEPNSVVAVVQKGYTLNERLVRAAMVMVSKDVSPQIDEKA
jgi:molecular chaperone GrpE